MRTIGLIVLTFFLTTAGEARAQTALPSPSPSPTPRSLEKNFAKNVLRDQKAIWTSPLRLERDDLKWVIPAGIGAMALFTTDRITGDEIGESDRPVNASRFVSYAGSVYALGAAATTFYLVGRQTNNSRARETGVLSAEALVNGLFVGGALKVITQRARPADGHERSEFFDGGSSFPSGHSLNVWSVATVVANEYHDRPLVKFTAYGIASAVSIARVTEHKHYISDVVVGSAAGWAIGRYVYHTHHRDDSDPAVSDTRSRWPTIVPQYSGRARRYGIGLTWSF